MTHSVPFDPDAPAGAWHVEPPRRTDAVARSLRAALGATPDLPEDMRRLLRRLGARLPHAPC